MAVIVNGDGILTGISSLATDLTDITSGRGTVTGVATVGTLQLGTGVSMSSPRTQNAAIFTNNTEFLTVDDAGRVGVGTVTPNSDAHPQNVGKINVGFITARSIAGDIDANTMVVAGIATFTDASTFKNNVTVTSGNLTMSGAGNIVLGDSASGTDDRITFGASTDFEIFHNGSNNHIDCHTAGQDLYIRPTKDVYFQDYVTDEKLIKMVKDGGIELYYNGLRKFRTVSDGVEVNATEGANAILALIADEGDDNADYWRILSDASSNGLGIGNYATGSWSNRLVIDSDGAVNIGVNPAQSTGSNTQNAIFTVKGYPGTEASAAILALIRGYNTTSAVANHTLGRIVFGDKQAGEYAFIEGQAEANGAVGDTPGRLVLSTAPDSTSAPTERVRIDSSGRLGIQGAATRALLEVRASGGSNTMLTALWGANEGTTAGTLSDNTDKAVRMGIHHYDTDALPYGLLVGSASNGVNNLTFGGGTSLMNAATEIKFNTAANSTTTSGTERMRITAGGVVQIGGVTANNADIDTSNSKLTIKQSANSQEDGIYIERSGERRGYYIYVGGALSTSDSLSISTNQLGGDTELMAIDRGGDIVVANNIKMNTSGKGIDFSATSNSSGTSTSELFDDYEEGTFTPTNTIGMTLTNNHGAIYTKIGRMVYVQMDLSFSGASDVSQCGIIQSLPFTSAGGGHYTQGNIQFISDSNGSYLDEDDNNTLLFVGPGETRIDIYNLAGGHLQTRAYLNGRRFRISMWYTAT